MIFFKLILFFKTESFKKMSILNKREKKNWKKITSVHHFLRTEYQWFFIIETITNQKEIWGNFQNISRKNHELWKWQKIIHIQTCTIVLKIIMVKVKLRALMNIMLCAEVMFQYFIRKFPRQNIHKISLRCKYTFFSYFITTSQSI